jgi:hypothetical protein
MTKFKRTPEALAELTGAAAVGWTNDDLATHFGVSTRTLERHRAADPEWNAAILAARVEYFEAHRVGHGVSRYSHGCRCGVCRAAATAAQAVWRHSRRSVPVPDDVPHGTSSTYVNWSCRCRPCTAANTESNRPYAAAFLARRKAGAA